MRFPRVRRFVRATIAVFNRVSDDGLVHAGNLAYLSLTTLFPVFLIIASVAGTFGRGKDGERLLVQFFQSVPADVAKLLGPPIRDLVARESSGGLLTFGILVGLWSASSFIETIRDIIRRAYGTTEAKPFWKRRLLLMGGTLLTVLLVLLAFTLQFVLTGAASFIENLVPVAREAARIVDLTRLLPPVVLFVALWGLMTMLTPRDYRRRLWPGALLTTVVWMGATLLLPWVIGSVADYQLTYGSLAGVMISLLFFYVVGTGLVAGAHLNAVLAGTEDAASREKRGRALERTA